MFTKRVLFLITTTLILFSGCDNQKEKKQEVVTNAKSIVVTEDAVKKTKTKAKNEENSGQFYYSYNKEKNTSNYNSKVRTELDAYRDIKSPYERVKITLMIQQLSPDYRLLCSACHDDYANGVIGPALLDKNASFIYNRILEFKTGKKKNVLMKQLVNRIDDSRLKSIAKEIERFNKQIKEMRRKEK